MTAPEFLRSVLPQSHSTDLDTIVFGSSTLAKMESRSHPQYLASLFKRRLWESQPPGIHHRVLKSPPFTRNATVPIHSWWIGTIFAGTLFFRFTFHVRFWYSNVRDPVQRDFRVAKESEQQTNEERISK